MWTAHVTNQESPSEVSAGAFAGDGAHGLFDAGHGREPPQLLDRAEQLLRVHGPPAVGVVGVEDLRPTVNTSGGMLFVMSEVSSALSLCHFDTDALSLL